MAEKKSRKNGIGKTIGKSAGKDITGRTGGNSGKHGDAGRIVGNSGKKSKKELADQMTDRSETKSVGGNSSGKYKGKRTVGAFEEKKGKSAKGIWIAKQDDTEKKGHMISDGKANKRPERMKRDGASHDNDKKWNGKKSNISGKDKVKRTQGAVKTLCPAFRLCGSCQYLDMPYEKQLQQKQMELEKLLGQHCKIYPIIGMKNPYHYRNKVHAVFGYRKGEAISGVYQAGSHEIVPIENCLIEDQKADEIIGTIRDMLKSFKIRTYDEDTGYGFLRHVLVKRGFATGEIMVVLVTASPVFPSKNHFVKALREKHPEITTIIQNINNRGTSMVLGDKEHVLFGTGYIEDILCGCRFRISSKSFYQINPVQTEVLYRKAMELAGLTGKETVIDAYCGIGTIGIIASKKAKQVIGVELNKDAVRDAAVNAKWNGINNIQFYCNDAGEFLSQMAMQGETVDVVFMDPPRSGSTETFIDSVAEMSPEKVVYISCGPESLERDLRYFEKKGYRACEGWGVDLFPFTRHVETIVLLGRKI